MSDLLLRLYLQPLESKQQGQRETGVRGSVYKMQVVISSLGWAGRGLNGLNSSVVPWHKVWPLVSVLLLDFLAHTSEKRLLRNPVARELKEASCDSSRGKEGGPVADIALRRG